ncbi:hypothetical protein MUNTM_55160 [Mycobacterium sp. MUNTM1]
MPVEHAAQDHPAGEALRPDARATLDAARAARDAVGAARRTTVSLADLAGMSFVDAPPGYGNRAVVDNAFAAAGVERTVAVEAADMATAATCIRKGWGSVF